MTRYYQMCPYCDHVAWEWKRRPFFGMMLKAIDILHRDNPKAGDDIKCQECKRNIPAWRINERYLKTRFSFF